jgi:hypothetical protein
MERQLQQAAMAAVVLVAMEAQQLQVHQWMVLPIEAAVAAVVIGLLVMRVPQEALAS